MAFVLISVAGLHDLLPTLLIESVNTEWSCIFIFGFSSISLFESNFEIIRDVIAYLRRVTIKHVFIINGIAARHYSQ